MNLKMLTDKYIFTTSTGGIVLEKGKEYELAEEGIVQDAFKILVPMKRAGKFKQVLINENEGELID